MTGKPAQPNVKAAPEMIGLCPDPAHLGEFYVPLSEDEFRARRITCPECARDLLVYRRAAEPTKTRINGTHHTRRESL